MAPAVFPTISGGRRVSVRAPLTAAAHRARSETLAIRRWPVTVHLRGTVMVHQGHATGIKGHGLSRTHGTSPYAAKAAA